MGTVYTGTGDGGSGFVALYGLKVSEGATFPVVVGGAGSGGAYINVSSWQNSMNGGAGGTSSFGSVGVGGGGGGTQSANGSDGNFSYRAFDSNHFVVGLCKGFPGGVHSTGGYAGGSGTAGYVLVVW
ncbi:hypothetical protein NB636_07905 [Oxalobacter aliiformigenes]|uniref:hypothetical protein n=1 Tax=Oxalobacter aliiformigenes TaxID=2946593 RepID=UPI0022AF7395|nr:hypothetical protein [Oxalobacter aliiformigenes]MCZ4065737.1 hypothetical protein [Oxalobacter aliiformigenes]WAV98631.1 hypothetical protein NB636_07905 [Oxalobacter aliiformigenes]